MLALPRAGHSQLPCFWCSSGCQFSRTAVNLSTSSSGGSGKLPFCGLLVGGWALPHVPFQVLWIGIPIPLKNDGVSNSWDDFPFPTGWKVIKAMFQSPPTIFKSYESSSKIQSPISDADATADNYTTCFWRWCISSKSWPTHLCSAVPSYTHLHSLQPRSWKNCLIYHLPSTIP